MSEVDDSQTRIGREAAPRLDFKSWCGWRGSNPRPLASEANTLSTELQPQTEGCIVGVFTEVPAIIAGCFQRPRFLEDTMSDNSQANVHDEAHTGPIKNSKQLLLAVFFSFVVPIFAIIGLVYYVTSDKKPASGAVNLEKALAARIQKIGTIEIRDANRQLKSGEEVFKAQCTACHTAGAAGAPKFGDAAAWAPRIATGYEALLNSAVKGKNAMGPQGGGDFETLEIGRAVVYMANAAGGKLEEPKAAAAPAAAAASAAK